MAVRPPRPKAVEGIGDVQDGAQAYLEENGVQQEDAWAESKGALRHGPDAAARQSTCPVPGRYARLHVTLATGRGDIHGGEF